MTVWPNPMLACGSIGPEIIALTYLVIGGGVLAGIIMAWFAWRLTRRIQRPWLHSMIRAFALAAALTPTIVPVPPLHGALPMPAVWVLAWSVFGFGNEDRMFHLRYGGIPLLIVFSFIWLFSMAITYSRNDHAAS